MADDNNENENAAEASVPRKKRLKTGVMALAILVSVVCLIDWNATVTWPVMQALSDDGPHDVMVYRRWLLSPNEIVFDIRSASTQGSMADMDRLLFKAAEALKDRQFDHVVLAYHGSGKMLLAGDLFRLIGQTREFENPVYLIRTLTEHVTNIDGTPAFGTWTGGWLGVLGKQLDDHNQFHQRWWVQSATN